MKSIVLKIREQLGKSAMVAGLTATFWTVRDLVEMIEDVGRRITQLKEVVEGMHNCKALHSRSEPVIELTSGQVAWDGFVEIFDLEGHPKAKRCYAWSPIEDGAPQYTTVLELPPVDSPDTPVKMAIAIRVESSSCGAKDLRKMKGAISKGGTCKN